MPELLHPETSLFTKVIRAKPLATFDERVRKMSVEMHVNEMRECGVYALPDGRELVAHSGGRFGFFKFYDPLAWKFEGPPIYEMDVEGKITSLGIPTPWRVEDLREILNVEL